jgi:hypothetical protein
MKLPNHDRDEQCAKPEQIMERNDTYFTTN